MTSVNPVIPPNPPSPASTGSVDQRMEQLSVKDMHDLDQMFEDAEAPDVTEPVAPLAVQNSLHSRPTESIASLNLTEFDETSVFRHAARVDRDEITRELSKLEQASPNLLTAAAIRARLRQLHSLPVSIHRMMRELEIARRRLFELKQQRALDERWQQLKTEQRLAEAQQRYDVVCACLLCLASVSSLTLLSPLSYSLPSKSSSNAKGRASPWMWMPQPSSARSSS